MTGDGGFEGARRDRLTDEWNPRSLAPSTIHRNDAAFMRARARDLVLNNPLAKSAVDSYIANVIECGITPKPLREDTDERKAWTEAWNRWGGEFGASIGTSDCDITGQQHIYELMALWLEEVLVGGGCLINYVVLPRAKARDRSIPLTIELIPEERFVDDRDDFATWMNNRKSSGDVSRGVEMDPATGRPVRYWLYPAHPNEVLGGGQLDPIPIEARNAHYGFFRRRVGQNRGYTLLHAAIMWLWKLGYYTDNELMASAIRSCYAVVIQQSPDEFGELDGLNDGDPELVDQDGNKLDKIQPGIVSRLTAPGKIVGVGPNTPLNDQSDWLLFIERTIAIASNLSYEELVRDFSKGTFSSTRAASNGDRKRFKPMQKFVVNHFCRPTYSRFVQWAAWSGLDRFPTLEQFAANPQEYINVRWRTPGWQSVNPWDDIRAAVLKVNEGLGTREDFIGNEGGDWEDVFEQIAKEQERKDELQLTFASDVDVTEGGEMQGQDKRTPQGRDDL